MDFVIEKGREIFGLEIKSKLKEPKITKSIKKFIDLKKIKRVYVFCENLDAKKRYKNCEIIFTYYLNIFYIIKNVLR